MTGTSDLFSQMVPNMSWLRFTDLRWLQSRTEEEPADAIRGEQLRLVEASPGASEFELGKTYEIVQRWDVGIYGDLGNFWHSEIAAAEPGEPIRVGPVPITNPERPISLEIQHQYSAITRVTAVAGSGATYVFAPAPLAL